MKHCSGRTRQIVTAGLIAAVYFVLGVVFAPISFGTVNLRVAEALTLLPVLTPAAVGGLFVGCVLTNIYGLTVGANILGAADIFIGSLATLLAAVLTRVLRRWTFRGLPVAAALPPILINAVVIGGELALVLGTEGTYGTLFLLQGLSVGLGQLIACGGLGLFLVRTLQRTRLDRLLFGEPRDR